MMKRRFFALLMAAVMVLSLVACGSGGGSGSSGSGGSGSSGGVTLTLMGNANDLAKSYMTKIFEEYEAATGNKLDIVSIEASNLDTVATSKFATGDIPDLFIHFNNSTLNNYNVDTNFYYMNDESWVEELTDGAKAYCQDSSGNILGLPFWESSVSGCYYNKALFDELGLKPATNQAEFDKPCQDLVDAGHTAICWPANDCNWMYQFGLDPLFADDPAQLEKINSNQTTFADIPAMQNMLEWVKNAADKGTYEGGNLNMLMVNKNSANKEAALEFIRFCATPENYNKAFDGVSTVSCFKGQTTNIQSVMVTDAIDSINELQRTSTAEPKIIGYTQNEVGSAVQEYFLGNVDAAGCAKLMDDYRMTSAKALGTPGF